MKVASTFELSKVIPVRSMPWPFVQRERIWHPVRRIWVSNCGILPIPTLVYEPCEDMIIPFPVSNLHLLVQLSEWPMQQQQRIIIIIVVPMVHHHRHFITTLLLLLLHRPLPLLAWMSPQREVPICYRHHVIKRSNCGMSKRAFVIIPSRIIPIGYDVWPYERVNPPPLHGHPQGMIKSFMSMNTGIKWWNYEDMNMWWKVWHF